MLNPPTVRAILLTLALPGLSFSTTTADPTTEYAARSAKLEGKKDPKAWLALADFAEEHLLWEKLTEALKKTVELDPDNAPAHARLDEVKAGKEWLPTAEAEAREQKENEPKGLVFYGAKWVVRVWPGPRLLSEARSSLPDLLAIAGALLHSSDTTDSTRASNIENRHTRTDIVPA